MSFYSEANDDAKTVAPDAAAIGRRVGFLDAFETSYQSQVRGSAMYGIEKAFHEAEAKQVEFLRGAGVEDVPHISDDAFGFFGSGAFSGDYMDAARFYQDGGDPEVAQRLEQYDKKIDEYRSKFPELRLRSSSEMWDDIRSTAQQYEQRSASERTTTGGLVGGLVGGMAGSLNVESDPFNFATIPLGVLGKTVAGRIGGQAAGQGAIEAVNQFTGVQEQRRLLGLTHGLDDALTRIGGAAIGGAVLQGAGEGFAAAGRRFFRNAPHDPAPAFTTEAAKPLPDASQVPDGAIPADPALAAAKLVQRPGSYMEYLQEVSPWAVSRAGKARTVLDIENVKTQLDDWSGPDAAFTKPDTAINLPRSDFVAPSNIFDRVAANTTHVDDIARKMDPETFRVYDKLADENATYRRWLEELQPARDGKIDTQLAEVNERIDTLNDKIARAGGMKRKTYMKELAALTAERDGYKGEALAADTPDMAKVRERLMRNDEKMRDMAPVVSRAYARARNKWDNTETERTAVRTMIREGRKNLGDVAQENPLASLPKSLYDKAPILKQAHKVENIVSKDADAADVAMAIIAENAKQMDEVLERFRASVAALVEETPKEKMFHGGPAGITKFTDEFNQKGELKDQYGVRGIYATKEKDLAKMYVPKENGKLYEVELDYKNPLHTPSKEFPEISSAALSKADIDKLKAAGYDAIVDEKRMETVVFDSSQIREVKGEAVKIDGVKRPLNLDNDKITVPTADGTGTREISIRQLLDEQNELEADMKAVSSCSIR